MAKSWFYLENYVYVNTIAPDAVLLYNTLNHKILKYKNNSVYHFIEDMRSSCNNGVVEVDMGTLNQVLCEFIKDVRSCYMGDLLPLREGKKKPVLFPIEPTILKEGHSYFHSGEDILYNIMEVTFYINGKCSLKCKDCNQYSKQFICCQKNISNGELPVSIIETCLRDLGTSSLLQINITGGNIFDYSGLTELVEVLNGYSFKKVYKINIKQITTTEKLLSIFENAKNSIELLCTDFTDLERAFNLYGLLKKNDQIKINVLIQSENELEQINSLIDSDLEESIIYTPYYNGNNESFFQQNIYISQEDLINVSAKSIKRNYLLNNFFFGKLVCLPDGNIYADINEESLGNIYNDSFALMIYRELQSNQSWLRIRRKIEPCSSCLFASMCPPLSNYEKVIGRNNLCLNR